jgi:cell division protein FtsB
MNEIKTIEQLREANISLVKQNSSLIAEIADIKDEMRKYRDELLAEQQAREDYFRDKASEEWGYNDSENIDEWIITQEIL